MIEGPHKSRRQRAKNETFRDYSENCVIQSSVVLSQYNPRHRRQTERTYRDNNRICIAVATFS